VGRLYAEIFVKFSVLMAHTPTPALIWAKFGEEESTFDRLLHAKFHPNRCNVSPLWGGKPQNRPPP